MTVLEEAQKKAASIVNSSTGVAPPDMADEGIVDVTNQQFIVPAVYNQMGVSIGLSIPEPDGIVLMLLSFSGAGKSTFCRSVPNSLTVGFQKNSGGSVPGARGAHMELNTWAAWDKLYNQLLHDAPSRPFRVICIDTIDEWAEICSTPVIDKWNMVARAPVTDLGDVGQKGKGFGERSRLMLDHVVRLANAGYGVYLTGHLMEREVTVGRDTKTVVRPFMSNTTYKLLQIVTFVKAELSVSTVTHKAKVVTSTVPGAAPLSIMEKLAKPERDYRLSLHSNAIGDEVKIRLSHLPEYISVPRINGYDAFADAFRLAAKMTVEEEAALCASSTGNIETA